MNRFIKWHNSQIDWWKEKLGVSWYTVSWISFIKGALLVLVIVALTGCTIGEKRIKVFSVEEPRAKLNHPMPDALMLEKVRWIVITSENAEEVFAKLKKEGIDPVLFGLTDKDYELLSKNFAQIRAKLQETNNLLEQYKKYYESEEKVK
ncbi:MAG: hypothetical protein CBC05_02790 [Crocinitomicaceae bacterium TMED45]|nr:MAG: hypothetical protein CBC05_02790 [Crocinitomicaceae bacterium TMED45]|tara:strand:+ start:9905 stop:10351 length:447 start_codon:yes stop_codon:yes gene_type:complete